MKKIFDGVFDEEVHVNFLKFGRGIYKDKYLLEGKRQAKKWTIKGGAEYANFLSRRCLERAGEVVNVKGVIVSTLDLRNEITFDLKKVGNFQGVRKHVIDGEVKSSEIFALMNKYPKAFFALTFSGDGFVLKIKPKAPTSGKPGKEKEDGPTVDFCSLKTDDKNFIDELFFGVSNFDDVKVGYTIEVTDIVYPADMEKLKPTEIRELAKRKGVVRRKVVVDGVEKNNEAKFVA